jgi:hypothetical protein
MDITTRRYFRTEQTRVRCTRYSILIFFFVPSCDELDLPYYFEGKYYERRKGSSNIRILLIKLKVGCCERKHLMF